MAPTAMAPNTDNYYIGKGIVLFQPEGSTDIIDLGNVPELEFEPSIETLDHFSSRAGVRVKDKTIVLERGGTLRIVMDEWTPQNLSFLLMGDVDMDAVGGPKIQIYEADVKSGKVWFYGTNEVGPRWNMYFPKVDFVPSSSINPISDEYGQLEVEAQVASSATEGFGFVQWTNSVTNEVVPTFLAVPAVTLSYPGAAPQVGVPVTANVGSFLGDPTPVATYQWEGAGTPIVGATAQTYTPVVGDVGDVLTCVVTITNEVAGDEETDSAESAASPAVIAA